jgi:2',3'-cyclic-nucleotide 2'-phosphodiesterase (5'-nucleotidase family)
LDRLTLVHTTDLHGGRNGAQRLVGRVLARYPGALWLDSGDALAAGNLTLGLTRERTLEWMSDLGCSAMALGNREFELTAGSLRRKLARARFPVLCTNLVAPEGLDQPVRPEALFATPEGRRVRVLGALRSMVCDPAARLVSPFRFREPAEALRERAAEASADELVIVLSHLGEAADRELLARVPRLDLVLGGHSHWSWLHREEWRVAVSRPWAEERALTVLTADLGRLAVRRASAARGGEGR